MTLPFKASATFVFLASAYNNYAKRELVKHNLLEQTFVQHFQSSREIRTELSVGLLLIQGSDHP